MVRNEYRRALIMLRALQNGYSGHVRLEQRTMMGSMGFSVRTDQSAVNLQAALIGQARGASYVAPLGQLRKDARGQAQLSVNFDPRNISGRPIDAYRLIVVCDVGQDRCEIVLSGNLNGSFEVNWGAAREAVCQLYAPAEVDAEGPEIVSEEQDEAEIVLAADDTDSLEDALMQETPDLMAETPKTDESLDLIPDSPESDAQILIDVRAIPSVIREKQAEVSFGDVPSGSPSPLQSADDAPAGDADAQDAPLSEADVAENPSAAELLTLSSDSTWPEDLKNVQTLFRMSPAFQPFEADGYVFIRAPMPPKSGYPYCAIGLSANDGKIASVCYALPGQCAPESPAGLEGYLWRNGPETGWWAIFLDAETGEEIDAP